MTTRHGRRIVLRLWEFSDAPAQLRRLLSRTQADGWLAEVSPDGDKAQVLEILTQWRSAGLSIEQYEAEDGRVILAGPHPRS